MYTSWLTVQLVTLQWTKIHWHTPECCPLPELGSEVQEGRLTWEPMGSRVGPRVRGGLRPSWRPLPAALAAWSPSFPPDREAPSTRSPLSVGWRGDLFLITLKAIQNLKMENRLAVCSFGAGLACTSHLWLPFCCLGCVNSLLAEMNWDFLRHVGDLWPVGKRIAGVTVPAQKETNQFSINQQTT